MTKYVNNITHMSDNNIPDLDEVVLWALDLFLDNKEIFIPNFHFNKAVIIGSGNAKNTIKIIYEWQDVIFADETNYEKAIARNWVDSVIIYSASWWKHAPIVAQYALSQNKKVKLITCNENSETSNILNKEDIIITPKNKEPYTYNTSTYMWWILANTKENPEWIIQYIENNISKIIPNNFSDYNWFLFAIPDKFAGIAPLVDVKFIELFWRNISRDIKTFEELKHAITVVPCKKELCIKFWPWEIYFQWDILNISLPHDLWLAWFMAVTYYIVWKIQKQLPPYFKENIWKYIQNLNKSEFWKWMWVIV